VREGAALRVGSEATGYFSVAPPEMVFGIVSGFCFDISDETFLVAAGAYEFLARAV